MVGLDLYNFQEACVDRLITFTSLEYDKTKMILKAPTGSGKTIMLIDYIDKILSFYNNICFVWFCPGIGELEEQSKTKMDKYIPGRATKTLHEILNNDIEAGDTIFINWEQVSKKGNKAITENETDNLFDKIDKAKNNDIKFIVIIDESHRNDTDKANSIVKYINPEKIIKVSATPEIPKKSEEEITVTYDVNEEHVIEAGLITKYVLINDDLNGMFDTKDPNASFAERLVKKAIEKQQEIQAEYKKLKKNINPLVLIQMPDEKKDSDNIKKFITKVKDLLKEQGVLDEEIGTWLSNEVDIDKKEIVKLDNKIKYLFFKQAIATGWDCPRAKILLKFRETGSVNFEIQTIGRIRRMPSDTTKVQHFANEILDNCYIYTDDKNFKLDIITNIDNANEPVRYFIKDEYKNYGKKFIKESRSENLTGVDAVKAREYILKEFMKKYNLKSKKYDYNKNQLINNNFSLDTKIESETKTGKIRKSDEIDLSPQMYMNDVDTNWDGFKLRDITNKLSYIVGVSYEEMNTILRGFFEDANERKELLNLKNKHYYAFVWNNREILQNDFIEIMQSVGISKLTPEEKEKLKAQIARDKTSAPLHLQEEIKVLLNNKDANVKILDKNIYKNYPSNIKGMSKPESAFCKYCNENEKVETFWKNGDKGQEYLSVLCENALGSVKLFYPDFIVWFKNGDVLIAETKGGENEYGENKNIDEWCRMKFDALKRYQEEYNDSNFDGKLKIAFIRDKENYIDGAELYYSDIEYTENLNLDSEDTPWKNIKNLF